MARRSAAAGPLVPAKGALRARGRPCVQPVQAGRFMRTVRRHVTAAAAACSLVFRTAGIGAATGGAADVPQPKASCNAGRRAFANASSLLAHLHAYPV
jgi:hypothetical protein